MEDNRAWTRGTSLEDVGLNPKKKENSVTTYETMVIKSFIRYGNREFYYYNMSSRTEDNLEETFYFMEDVIDEFNKNGWRMCGITNDGNGEVVYMTRPLDN